MAIARSYHDNERWSLGLHFGPMLAEIFFTLGIPILQNASSELHADGFGKNNKLAEGLTLDLELREWGTLLFRAVLGRGEP